MTSFNRFLAIGAVALLGGSCTALKVVTHNPSIDPVDLPTGAYRVDPHHWSITFDVDHLGYSRFTMRFDRAAADLDFQATDPEHSRVEATIDAASIDTNVPDLDSLVKGPDMLDADHYPDIRFVSTELRRTGKNSGEMTGNLTIKGESRPITLAVAFNGGAPNPLTGEDTLGFTATGHVDRASFGLGTWFPAVGDDLHVTIQAEFVRPREKL
jgi:polyisoprenoid-binding protein YceI